MKRKVEVGDRVQLTRYWLLHHSMKGAPRVPHTEDDVGVVIRAVRSMWKHKDGKYVRVHWVGGPPRPDSNMRIEALEPHGTPREFMQRPAKKDHKLRGE